MKNKIRIIKTAITPRLIGRVKDHKEKWFPHHFINKLVYEMKYKEQKSNPVNKLTFCNFSHVPGLYEKVRHAVKKFNINLVAKTTRKLKYVIHSKINPVPNDEIAGIYIIPLLTEAQEEKVYIGMTGRKLKDRLKEHVSDWKLGNLFIIHCAQ